MTLSLAVVEATYG